MVLRQGLGGRGSLRFGLDGTRNLLMFKHKLHDIKLCIFSLKQTDIEILIIQSGVQRLIDEVYDELMGRYISCET